MVSNQEKDGHIENNDVTDSYILPYSTSTCIIPSGFVTATRAFGITFAVSAVFCVFILVEELFRSAPDQWTLSSILCQLSKDIEKRKASYILACTVVILAGFSGMLTWVCMAANSIALYAHHTLQWHIVVSYATIFIALALMGLFYYMIIYTTREYEKNSNRRKRHYVWAVVVVALFLLVPIATILSNYSLFGSISRYVYHTNMALLLPVIVLSIAMISNHTRDNDKNNGYAYQVTHMTAEILCIFLCVVYTIEVVYIPMCVRKDAFTDSAVIEKRSESTPPTIPNP